MDEKEREREMELEENIGRDKERHRDRKVEREIEGVTRDIWRESCMFGGEIEIQRRIYGANGGEDDRGREIMT